MLYSSTTLLIISAASAGAMMTTTRPIVPQSALRSTRPVVMRPWLTPTPTAKSAWLSKQDVPTWGPSAGIVAAPDEDPSVESAAVSVAVSESEDDAKAAWLAKQQVPLGQASSARRSEEAAKAVWLSKQHLPMWGASTGVVEPTVPTDEARVAEAVPAVASASEDGATATWLAKPEAPKWGPGSSAPGPFQPAVPADEPAWRRRTDEAVAAWLAKQSLPSSGPPARVETAPFVKQAPPVEAVQCDFCSFAAPLLEQSRADAKAAWMSIDSIRGVAATGRAPYPDM